MVCIVWFYARPRKAGFHFFTVSDSIFVHEAPHGAKVQNAEPAKALSAFQRGLAVGSCQETQKNQHSKVCWVEGFMTCLNITAYGHST